MKESPLKKLEALGQSIWLDYIRRDLIASGELRRLIKEDGLRGITSNPAIFEQAIAQSHIYDQDVALMARNKKDVTAIYEALSLKDIQNAADEFRPVYERTDGEDGMVSLEVNPHLSHDTEGTIQEARRLWASLERPNVLIKVPATSEGLPAIQELISEGINVNVTLLFGIPRYREVQEAYLSGLETRAAQGKPIHTIVSVASFFLSRIDQRIDPYFERCIESLDKKKEKAKKALGSVAISSAKISYQIYKETFSQDRFKKLEEKGARVQRLLFASTGSKNPNYSDIKYVEELIGTHTVNTLPPATLAAYRDHGDPKLRLEDDFKNAEWILTQLPEFGINLDKIAQELEDDGVKKFVEQFDKLMGALTKQVLRVAP